jgi:hypothetical protein
MMLMSGGGGDVPKRAKEKRRGWEKRRVYIGSRRMRLCSWNLAALRTQGLGSEVVSCYERPNPKSTRSEETVVASTLASSRPITHPSWLHLVFAARYQTQDALARLTG